MRRVLLTVAIILSLLGSFYLGGVYMLFVTQLTDEQAKIWYIDGRLKTLAKVERLEPSVINQLFVMDTMNAMTSLAVSYCIPDQKARYVDEWISEIKPYAEQLGLTEPHHRLRELYEEHKDDEPEWIVRFLL